MPLLKGKKNIGHNIEVEEAHGKPRDQAVAIALRTAGVPKKGAKDDLSTMVDPIPLSPNGTLPFYQTEGPIDDAIDPARYAAEVKRERDRLRGMSTPDLRQRAQAVSRLDYRGFKDVDKQSLIWHILESKYGEKTLAAVYEYLQTPEGKRVGDAIPEDKDAWAEPRHSREMKEKIMQGYTGDRRAADVRIVGKKPAWGVFYEGAPGSGRLISGLYADKAKAEEVAATYREKGHRVQVLPMKPDNRATDAVLPVDESTRDAVRRYNRGETRTRDTVGSWTANQYKLDGKPAGYVGVAKGGWYGFVYGSPRSTRGEMSQERWDDAAGARKWVERSAVVGKAADQVVTRSMYARPVSMPAGERNQPAVAPVPTEDWNPDAGERGMFYGIAKEAKAKKRRAAAKKAAKTRKRNRARDDDAVIETRYAERPKSQLPLTSVVLSTPADVEKVYGRKLPMKELGKAFGKANDGTTLWKTKARAEEDVNRLRAAGFNAKLQEIPGVGFAVTIYKSKPAKDAEARPVVRVNPAPMAKTVPVSKAKHVKDSLESEAREADRRDAKVIRSEAARGQLTAEEIARKHGFPVQFVKDVLAGKAKDRARAADSVTLPPAEELDRAFRFEIQGDRRMALDCYRRAAAGFTQANDAKNAQVARDGEEECRLRLAGSFDNTYVHPQQGRARAYDSESAALRVALERTRAGEDVSLVGQRVMPRRAEARDASVEMYKGWEISEDVKEDAIVAKKPGKPSLYATNVAQAKRIIDQREAGTATGHQKVVDVKPVEDEHEGFGKLERSLAHRKGVSDPKALAAAIGREKYGAKGMAAKAAAGSAKDADRYTVVHTDRPDRQGYYKGTATEYVPSASSKKPHIDVEFRAFEGHHGAVIIKVNGKKVFYGAPEAAKTFLRKEHGVNYALDTRRRAAGRAKDAAQVQWRNGAPDADLVAVMNGKVVAKLEIEAPNIVDAVLVPSGQGAGFSSVEKAKHWVLSKLNWNTATDTRRRAAH